MAGDIVFFLASDDETAAATRNSQPGRAFISLTFHGFAPDDAVVEWARYFEVADDWPHFVAEFRNDGVGVFVVSEELLAALAEATPEDLRGLVARWGEFLVRERDELTHDEQVAVVEGVAGLAGTAVESAGTLRLYCWQY